MALMQITIVPIGTNSTSVGEYVAGVQKLLRKKEFQYELCDMGTIIHGTSRQLLSLAGEIHEFPFTQGVHRVVTNIMLDDRRDKVQTIGEKKQAVLDRLERNNEG